MTSVAPGHTAAPEGHARSPREQARAPRGFVRAEGTRIVDDSGPLLLRGVGLGNWMLPEGYMWRFGDELASPRQIEARIETLVGPERAAEFWRRFRDDFVSERDIELIAGFGFDHVRLPMNARYLIDDDGTFREDGFALVERAVAWSEAHGLRILLDLHGAPGGQTGTNIDDSPRGMPELFMDDRYRALTVRLWEEIARRYRDRESVLGYDLLNEPLPHEWQHRYNDELVSLYRELTAAIRRIDDRHLLMYEGSHWATNWTPLAERFDDNQVLQFHRYWCAPDETSIAAFLETRERLATPIYMGEGGENTPAWVYAATRLYERHDIGWNFWPWKKTSTFTSPLSAAEPARWELIADPARTPAADEAWAVLEEYLAAIPADACAVRTPILDALFARPRLTLPAWAGVRDDGRPVTTTAVDGIADTAWEYEAGADDAARTVVSVPVGRGSGLSFPFAEAPGDWQVTAEPAERVHASWTGGRLHVTADGDARISAVMVEP